MLNFFNWIEPGYDFSKRDRSFEEVLRYTKDFFEEQLTKEKMSAHINDLLALELHPILKTCSIGTENTHVSTQEQNFLRKIQRQYFLT